MLAETVQLPMLPMLCKKTLFDPNRTVAYVVVWPRVAHATLLAYLCYCVWQGFFLNGYS